MHNISYDKNKKALIASISGNISVDDANAMLMDFKRSVSGLNAKEHVLVISPENVSASLFVLPILQSFIQVVSQLKFKKIYLINSDKYAGIIKQSLSSNGMSDSVQFANSVREALNKR